MEVGLHGGREVKAVLGEGADPVLPADYAPQRG